MRVIGVDPSLTNLGYVVLEGDKILEKGRLQTETGDGLNLQRYVSQAAGITKIIQKYEVKHLATEAPFFQAFSTEILFALQSILHLSYWSLGLRVVTLAPLTIKGYACPHDVTHQGSEGGHG
jgi:Holliday junction resolvasome RuvABC endonuclease subunit